MSSRTTRSQANAVSKRQHVDPRTPSLAAENLDGLRTKNKLPLPRILDPSTLTKELKKLPPDDLDLIQLKQRKLREPDAQVPAFIREQRASSQQSSTELANAAAATLVFAWEAAGTAVCISSTGLLLTCSHCIAESKEEYKPKQPRWLLFASGDAVQAKPVAWDPKRDLALLQITTTSTSPPFPFIHLSPSPPKPRQSLLCIGHPGSEDLEASQSGIATDYDVLHISEGKFRGFDAGQDVQDNSEIGALKHDCWTYWGHSGAPLIDAKSGRLVGLHSSWDDETAMRRGVAWECLREFLKEWCVVDW